MRIALSLLLLTSLLGASLAADTIPVAQVQVTKLPGRRSQCGIWLSPDYRHVVGVIGAENRMQVVYDGVLSPQYTRIGTLEDENNLLEQNRGHWLKGASSFTFTANGSHLAYRASRAPWSMQQRDEFIVVDGVAGKVFSRIDGPYYTPNDRHLVYMAYHANGIQVVVDGDADRAFTDIANLRFSPDGAHYAYFGRQGIWYFVLDGNLDDAYTDHVVNQAIFSPDSTHIAYVAVRDKQHLVVRDRHRNALFDFIQGSPIFSPDSQRLCYIGCRKKTAQVIVDEQAGPGYMRIAGQPLFSPDSQHLAYFALTGKEYRCVRDGSESPGMTAPGEMAFSPDSRHLYYTAVRGNKHMVYRDDDEGPAFDEVSLPVCSPDSQHDAYRGRRGSNWHVISDGHVGAAYTAVALPQYTSDGHLYCTVKRGKKTYLLCNGQESPAYRTIAFLTVHAKSGQIAYAAETEEGWRVVRNGVSDQVYATIPQAPVFSPDGRYLAYVAQRVNQWFIIVDQQEYPAKAGLVGNTQLIFDADTHLYGAITDQSDWYRVEITMPPSTAPG
jgi:Tol biopolymer transport system component